MSIQISRPDESLLLSLMIQKTSYKGTNVYIHAFEEIALNKYAIPFAFALKTGKIPKVSAETRAPLPFSGSFRTEVQRQIFVDTLTHLNVSRTCILAIPVGRGKTFVALCLAAFIGLKTLIIIPTSKKVLQLQWRDEIAKFVPQAKVQILASKSRALPETNIYIIGSHTVNKLASQIAAIPFVIVDELHLVLSDKGHTSLFALRPQYLLGLSATPYRLDGSNMLVELFFGRNQVSSVLEGRFVVHVIFTPFQYILEQGENGRLNWDYVLRQQAECDERNSIMADIICDRRPIKFLVLCKRVSQIKSISQKCRERDVAVQAVYDDILPVVDGRSLIGTPAKLGVGFSCSSFGALIVAGDCRDYYIQLMGRVLRSEDAHPDIYDFVDDCYNMKQHYKERLRDYLGAKGTIRSWQLNEFLENK